MVEKREREEKCERARRKRKKKGEKVGKNSFEEYKHPWEMLSGSFAGLGFSLGA